MLDCFAYCRPYCRRLGETWEASLWLRRGCRSRLGRYPLSCERQVILTMHLVPRRVDHSGSDKNQQVLLGAVGRLALKQLAEKRQIAEHGNLVVNLVNLFGNQSSQHHRLAVPYVARRGHFPDAEVG